MDKLIPGIVIAALSAVTFLAYKHHRAYKRLCVVITVAGSLILIGLSVWDAAISLTHRGLLEYIPVEKLVAAKAARDQMFLVTPWVAGGWMATLCYLQFLYWGLPWLLGDEKPPEK